MKKRFLILSVMLLSSFYMNAQSDFNIGFTLGGGLGDFRGEFISDDIKSQVSIVYGMEVQKSFGDHMYLRSGISYGKKEVEFETFTSPNDFDLFQSEGIPINISAFTIPVYFGYRSTGDFRFHVNAGPFISFITDEENISVKSFDYGIGASLGIEYALSTSGTIRFEILNELGLADISDPIIEIENTTIRTNRLGAYVTYFIRL